MSEPQGTGDCFEVAANLIVYSHLDGALCHGMVTHPETGERHSHAWIEVTRMIDFPGHGKVPMSSVIDKSNGHDANLPPGFYYNVGRIDEASVRRYNREETMRWLRRSKHYGPWEVLA